MQQNFMKVLNGIALQQVLKNPQIPDARLGIGAGERLEPQPIQIPIAPKQNVKQTIQSVRTIDDLKWDGRGKQFHLDEFPSDGWMGNYIE